ncbi:MAG: hypothetical protein HKN47_22100 [Pirellulaceae bacterium]|nr:hypothetical protein [Pirellulaceae bacterium]
MATHLTLVLLTYFGPSVSSWIADLFAEEHYLWRLFCVTGTSNAVVAWVILVVPRIMHAVAATLLVAISVGLLWIVDFAATNIEFGIVSSTATALLVLVCRIGGIRLWHRNEWADAKHRVQFTLRAMMLMSAIVAMFLAARIATAALTSHVGWMVCNTILFSACDAGISVGLFYAILRPRYLIVSALLAVVVYLGMSALALYWMPVEEFPKPWEYWWVVGHQTLIHAGYVLIPVLVARLLGYRLTFQSPTQSGGGDGQSDAKNREVRE